MKDHIPVKLEVPGWCDIDLGYRLAKVKKSKHPRSQTRENRVSRKPTYDTRVGTPGVNKRSWQSPEGANSRAGPSHTDSATKSERRGRGCEGTEAAYTHKEGGANVGPSTGPAMAKGGGRHEDHDWQR